MGNEEETIPGVDMLNRLKCSSCGAELPAPDDAPGRKLRCPRCGRRAHVPVANSLATEAALAGASAAHTTRQVLPSSVCIKIQCPCCGSILKSVAAKGEGP